jgi:hypothetical protein
MTMPFLDSILTDFGPARVLCAGSRAAELAAALKARGVHADLLAPPDLPSANPRYDLGLGVDLAGLAEAAVEPVLDALCQHSEVLLLSFWSAAEALAELDLQPTGRAVAQLGRRSFYRDVDYDAGYLGPGALCLRRLSGSPTAVLAAYERLLADKQRELAAQRLVSKEYRDTVLQRDLEIESLHKVAERAALLHELDLLRARVAPPGTTRERYLNGALSRARTLGRAALRGLAIGEQVLRGSRAERRGASRS